LFVHLVNIYYYMMRSMIEHVNETDKKMGFGNQVLR